jgi:hypothetical protein
MPPSTDLLQGTLDLLILKTLALESMHGWGIAQRIQQGSKEAVTLHLNLKISLPCFPSILSPFHTPVIVVKADTHVLKSHTKWWVSFVSDLSTKWRSWESASSADWSTALEREAVSSRRLDPPLAYGTPSTLCLSSAPPKPKTLALLALRSHSRSWYQI